MKLLIISSILISHCVFAEGLWKNNPYNWDNSKYNFNNSKYNWNNNKYNWENNPRNLNSNRIIRGLDGKATGYAVPKLNGFNYFNLEGERNGYINE